MVFGLGKSKEIPKDLSILDEYCHIETTNAGEFHFYVPVRPWRHYIEQKIKQDATKKDKKKLLEKGKSQIISEVMPKGSIDLGGGCKIIKCPSKNKAVCGICKLDGNHICNGPVYKKNNILLPDSYTARGPITSCPYYWERLENWGVVDKPKKIKAKSAKEICKVLSKRDDYEIVDMKSRYDEL